MNAPLLYRHELREQQVEIVDLMAKHPAIMFVFPMGGGKTGATLTMALDALNIFDVRRVLVLGPLRVARDVWADEVLRWQHTRLMSVAIAIGTEKQRTEAVASDAEITCTNFENLTWLFKHVGGARGWPFDCVIIDESSAFKAGKKRTSTTKRKNAKGESVVVKGGNLTRFGALTQVRNKIRRIYLLTGTPAPNGVHDLWGQIYLLDQGKRLGSTMSEFEDRYFIKNRFSYEMKERPGAAAEIMERIGDVMIALPPPADLPEPTFMPVRVQMPRAAIDEYARFKRDMVSALHDVEAVSRGVLTNKLLQFANGSMYREDRSIAEIRTAKLDALDDLIARAAGDPMLVLYSFKFDLAKIRERHPGAVVLNESETAIKAWNAGNIKILLAHPKSCAHGLNLQFGGHLGAWYGFTWSLELYQQANARLARPGQKWPVTMYQIVAQGTDDERLMSVLDSRDAKQEDITRAVVRSIRETS